MQEAQANLKQTAVDFLEAAEKVASTAAKGSTDPLDQVATGLFELGDLDPAISEEDLAQLKRDLAGARLLPETVVELVGLARQVAAVLTTL
jgi:hypothetical protein